MFRHRILRLLLLGYLDSNQEQMIAISAVSLPRNWGGIPRISAVFMDLVYALARTDTGPIWSRSEVSGSFLVTESRVIQASRTPARGARSRDVRRTIPGLSA